MKKRMLGFFASVFAGIAIIALAFNVATAPQNQPPLNVTVENTPLEVEVTNPSGMPIATNCTSVELWIAGIGTDGDQDHYSTQSTESIGDRTVVFTGSSVSGNLVFSSENGEGSVPAAGKVIVSTTSGTQEFAIPFSSLYRVEHVTEILVEVRVSRPRLPGDYTWVFIIQASAFWYIEE